MIRNIIITLIDIAIDVACQFYIDISSLFKKL